MISEFNQIHNIFTKIDQHLTKTISIYIIGGAVLLYQNLKPATKDIDLILPDNNSYNLFLTTLKVLGFKKKEPTETYRDMEINIIMEKDDARFDIFLQQVCKKITLTTTMKNRAKPIIKLQHLTSYVCSNEDIFIFKSITQRKGDLEDCITLAKRGINWTIILNEIQSQIQQSNQDVWITWIAERLDLLVEKGVNIPVMDQINTLRDTYFDQLEQKFSEKNTSK